MKKTTLILLVLALPTLCILAQTKSKKVNVEWGDKVSASLRTTLSDIVGHDKSGIYTTRLHVRNAYGINTKVTLEHYDNKMNKTNSLELKLKTNKKKRDYESIFQLDNELYLLSTLKKKKMNSLYVQTINKKTLQPKSDLKKISEIDFSDGNKRNTGWYDVILLNDSSKILVFNYLPYEPHENTKVGLHVYDKKFKHLWQKKITLPYKGLLYDIEDMVVDDIGNVHFLGMIYKDKRKEKRGGKVNYTFEVLSIYENGTDQKKYPMKVDGKTFIDMKLAINNNQDLVCAGFYSSNATFNVEGNFFLTANRESKKIVSKEFQKFQPKFLTQNLSESQEKKKKKKAKKNKNVRFFNYNFRDIIINKDGSMIVVGEQFLVKESTQMITKSNGRTGYSTVYYYHFNDIIVIKRSAEGKIEWTNKIPKRQYSVNDGGSYSSYFLSQVNDKLYFMYNDNKKNLTHDGKGKAALFENSKGAIVMLATIDGNGKLTRESLFFEKESGVLTRRVVCEQISGSESIILGQKKKSHRFAKITFK